MQRHHARSRSVKNGDRQQERIITINVSGNRYQTYVSTLENYPNTLLGNAEHRRAYWNTERQEFFFDRPRTCFEAILYYYQSNGRLRRPDYVPLDTFIEEVSFFELGPHAMEEIQKLENVSVIKHIDLPNWFWRRYIWFYLEYPQHSIPARILYFISMLFTVLSCVSLAVETLPRFQSEWNRTCDEQSNNASSSITSSSRCSAFFSSPFFIIQLLCVSYFTIEFTLRLISTPSYPQFLLSVLNWIDVGAILPFFLDIAFELLNRGKDLTGTVVLSLRLLRILRFLRIFKVSLLFQQLKSLRVLSATLKESLIDFLLMIFILTLIAFLFGAATHAAERAAKNPLFDSIPQATYWGIVTVTTVG